MCGHIRCIIQAPCCANLLWIDLVRRLTPILSLMTLVEAIDTTRIHSVAYLAGGRTALDRTRPFRDPHHPISDAWLIGGGHLPRPGEVALAHNGILFLDELPEFRRHVLEGAATARRWVGISDGDHRPAGKRGRYAAIRVYAWTSEVSLAHRGILFLDELAEFQGHGLGLLCQTIEERVLFRSSSGPRCPRRPGPDCGAGRDPAELSRSTVVSHADALGHGGLGRPRDAGTYERGAHPRQRVVPLPMACPSDDAAS
jgi:hypothetical protein